MAVTTDDEAVLGLGAALLDQVSPEERDLLEIMAPDLLSARPRNGDGALGFGEADVAWLAAVVPVASVVVEVLLSGAKDAASDLVKEGILTTVRRFRVCWRGQAPADKDQERAPDPVPEELVERASQRAYEHSVALGLDEARARTLASAVAGSLASPPPMP